MAAGARRGSDRRPRWQIEDVLARTDLARLLDEVAEPATYSLRGRRWHCPVPDHQDRHASVTMRTDNRGHERWRCWSGDDTHRGDAIDLVQVTQRLDRSEAIEWLASRAGLSPDRPLPPPPRRRSSQRPTYVPLEPAVVQYVQACERILATSAGKPVRDWLVARGIGPDVAKANHLGADPGRRLLPRRKGLPFGASPDFEPLPAATFPALDAAGNIRYVQARYLDPDAAGNKYDNPAAAMGHNPRLSWTVPVGPRRPGVLIVTEGIPDALTAAQAGYTAVGILGSQAPDASVATRIATRADRDGLTIVAVADANEAGRNWADRLSDLLAEHNQEPHVIEAAVGTDLNDWALSDPTWTDAVDALAVRRTGIDGAQSPEASPVIDVP